MRSQNLTISRRSFIRLLASLSGMTFVTPAFSSKSSKGLIIKTSSLLDESIPAIGMGTWQTFDVEDDDELAIRIEILKTFFNQGGTVIDSSPMYGRSEEVIGYCLKNIHQKHSLFAATKVWIQGQWLGIKQMQHSRQLWGVKKFDLMQIHNMVDWQSHLETLKEWKADGKIRYIGITTSHGRRHSELEAVLEKENFDFVQFTYNLIDREVEERLLPLAAERRIAVIINRPFQGGSLFNHVRKKKLPSWASEIDCQNWAQFFLKFIISHPHVTCAIPATSQVAHMQENMGAGYGRLPDEKMRKMMLEYFKK